MSGLKDRLRRLTGITGAEPSVSQCAREAEEETLQLSGGEEADYGEEELEGDWQRLGAARIRNDSGAFIRRRQVYALRHRHGHYRLADLFQWAGELAAFHPEAAADREVDASSLLFFDTETTGLGHGAGNVPFMIGLGYWSPEGFVVEQMFIRNPAEELAMLAYLKPLLARFPYLVTYNGKSFDWPLLQNRFIMHRMKEGLAEPMHLDFLYASRSLWRNTLPTCKLGKVEETQLGFGRIDDVPGAMAPSLYFLYLSDQRPGTIAPVFQHNELDIVSLAGLAVLFAQVLAGGADWREKTPEEQLRLGLWLHRMGKEELAWTVLLHLKETAMKEEGEALELLRPLLLTLAAHFKRLGAWEEATGLWLKAIAADRAGKTVADPVLEPYIELAMHCEHRLKEPAEALLYAEEALHWAEKRQEALQAVQRRSKRQQARKKGAASWTADPLNMLPASTPESEGEAVAALKKRVARLQAKLLQKANQAVAKPEAERDQAGGRNRLSSRKAGGQPSRTTSKRSSLGATVESGPDSLLLF